MFLLKVESAVSTSRIETIIKSYLNQFFKEYNLPMPRIKIVDRMTAGWLGRDVYNRQVDKNNTTMEIQKSITNDEKTLDRVIAHELIHHFTFLNNFAHPEKGEENWKSHVTKVKIGFKPDGHGKEFQEWAAKINAVKGADYVTEKSDASYVSEVTKDYYLLIVPLAKSADKFGWMWSVRPSTEQKLVIQQKIMEGAKLLLSRDERFMTGARIKKYGGVSVPRDAETKKKLQDLFESGKDIKPNWQVTPKESTYHSKMLNHYGKDMADILKNDPLGVLK